MIRVLVVEPDPMYRKLFPIWIRDHFQPLGVEVRTAAGADEALESARQARPDVLLTAFELEGKLDGLQLARHLRGKRRDLPVIVISKKPYLRLRRRLAKLPGAQYLARPIGESTFVETVSTALQAASAITGGTA